MKAPNSKETQIELSKLRWHCRRGVKELDVVLSHYLDNHYLDSATNHQQAFKALMKLEDPILMSLVFEQTRTDSIEQNEVLEIMKKPTKKNN